MSELKKCRWCERMVDPEECWADPILTGGEAFWVWQCGELVMERVSSGLPNGTSEDRASSS